MVTNNRSPGTRGGDAATTADEIIQMGGQSLAFFGDVSDFLTAEKIVQTAIRHFGRIDILVNNVGVHPRKDIWDLTEADWDSTMLSHLKSAFNCIRHACIPMKEQRWGRILNCTSGSWLGTPGMCNYSAAKAGIVGLTRSVARDLGKFGITCNAYHPMAMTRRTRPDDSGDPFAVFRKRFELGLISKQEFDFLCNLPDPAPIGDFIAYLATDEAQDINGQVLYVGGGDVAVYTEPAKKNLMHKEDGTWSVAELIDLAPQILLKGYKNPVPAERKPA